MDDVEDFLDARFDIIDLLRERFFEEFFDGTTHFLARNDLSGGGDGCAEGDRNRARFRFQRACREPEDGALAGAVLAHERDFRAPADGKIGLDENRLFVAEPEGDLIEPEDDFVLGHGECNAFAF